MPGRPPPSGSRRRGTARGDADLSADERRLRELAARLEAAGSGELRRELLRALRLAVRPVTPRSRANARERLPSRNGLAERVAKAPQRVTARAGTSTATVKLVVSNKKSGAYGADASGVIRHPVFGRVNASGKRVFVAQRVQRGWFEDATIDSRPGMRAEVVAVLDDFADRITRGL